MVEVLGLLEATRESLTGGAMSGWGETDGAPEWLSMVVQAHRDADSRFGAAHVVAEIEVVENILDDLRVELLRLHCGGAVEDVGRVEDVLGREVEPDGHRNGHDEDDVTPAAPAPKGGAEREAAMTHDAAGCALLACELCDAYGSGWAAGVQVCEGLADGLALAARDPWPAVVMGGTASYRNRDLARWLAGLGPVQVWSDGDRAGVEASGVLAKRVAALGGRASIERVGVGEDPGAAGAPVAPLDVATVEDYAADL